MQGISKKFGAVGRDGKKVLANSRRICYDEGQKSRYMAGGHMDH